jgi:glycosyltransferase involved in cell wall biosynthesis
LAIALREAGWCVLVVSMLVPCAFEGELARAGVDVVSLRMTARRRRLGGIVRLILILMRFRPAALLTFNFPATLAGRGVGTLLRIPVVVSSLRTTHFGTRRRDLLLRLTRAADTITVVNSARAGALLKERHIVTDDRLRVIHNALPDSGSPPISVDKDEVRTSLGLTPEAFVWLAVGNLRPAKDHPNLVAAVRCLRSRGRAFHVLVAGEGPLRSHVEGLIAEDGLERVITLLGHRSDVQALYAAADALVLSSAWEGLPNVVLEAAAAGLPVVATDTGGVRELVEDRVTGLVVPHRDAWALAEGMATMMDLTPQRRRAMGAEGRRHVQETFSYDRIMGEWKELLLHHVGASRDSRVVRSD